MCARDDHNCPQFELHLQELLDTERRSFLKSAFVASGGALCGLGERRLSHQCPGRPQHAPVNPHTIICRRRPIPTAITPSSRRTCLVARGVRFQNPSPKLALVKGGRGGRRSYRHRRCTQSHCSGCSRTQPSTTSLIACMVACTSMRPSASRTALTSETSHRNRLSGSRIIRVP